MLSVEEGSCREHQQRHSSKILVFHVSHLTLKKHISDIILPV